MKEKVCSGCGQPRKLWRSKPPLCKFCAGRENSISSKQEGFKREFKPKPHIPQGIQPRRNPIAKFTLKKLTEIKLSNQYYKDAITANQSRNQGKCRCDECNEPISLPRGRNVAHIIGSGANETLYLDPRNHFILGRGPLFGQCNCLWRFDESGEKEKMKLYPLYLEIRRVLNLEYYSS